MKVNDAVIGFVLVALGSAVLFAIRGYPKIPGQPVGPALFPGLIATGICITGLLLVVRGWRMRAGQAWLAWDDWVRSPRHVVALAVLLGSIVFYIAAANTLGFLPVALLIAVVATLVIHFAFYKLLRVPLPWGLLKNWAW